MNIWNVNCRLIPRYVPFLDVVLRFDVRGGLRLVDFDYIDNIVVGVEVVLQRYWSIE
jgi:hypothetical protein